MRNAGGYLSGTGPTGLVCEMDTFTCKHCCSVKQVAVRQRPEDIGGLCKCCMGLICGPCVDKGTCDPLEEKLKRMEARQDAFRSYGLG